MGNELTFDDPGRGALSPRERVRMALAHQQPDRVPVDLWAVPEVRERLQAAFGDISWVDVLHRLRVDIRWVAPDYVGPERSLPGGITVDAYGMWRKEVRHDFGVYHEYAGYPLAEARTAEDVRAWDWSRTEYWDMDSIRAQLDAFETEDDYFICYDLGGIFERSWGLLGMERFLVDLAENPEVPCAIMDGITDLYIANVTRLLKVAEGCVDMVYTWDDVAHQQGLLMSPRMWRAHIVPRHQRLNAAIRQAAPPHVKLMYHSCGAIFPLIPDLIRELGIDVLNPLQPQAKGMDPQRVKDAFGQEVSFHGGVDLQELLPHGTPEQVEAEARRLCNILGRGGGYVLSAAHYIQNDVPTENILALYGASRMVEE